MTTKRRTRGKGVTRPTDAANIVGAVRNAMAAIQRLDTKARSLGRVAQRLLQAGSFVRADEAFVKLAALTGAQAKACAHLSAAILAAAAFCRVRAAGASQAEGLDVGLKLIAQKKARKTRS